MNPSSLPQNESFSDLTERALRSHRAGSFTDAEKMYRDILAAWPACAVTYKNFGNTLLCLGKFEEAEKAYLRSLELKPDYPEAYNNLGNVLRLTGRFAEAERAFLQALALLPESAEVHNNFGTVLADSGRIEEAERAFRKAVVLKPDYAVAYFNRGNALRALGRREAAEKSYRQALAHKHDYPEAFVGLGQTLLHIGRKEEAEQAFSQALSLKPDCAEAYNGLGNLLMDLGRIEEAERAFQKTLSIRPDYASGKFGLSLLQLMRGCFDEGFKLFENRFDGGSAVSFTRTKALFSQLRDCRRWEGEALDGQSLLVITEQGAGDSLMMMRYLPLLKKQGVRHLVVYCGRDLKRVFRTIPAVDEVISAPDSLPVERIDCYCPIMSLPHLLHTWPGSIPVPYLSVPGKMKKSWRAKLQHAVGMKIGLVWGGNKLPDKRRSIPLLELSPLNDIPGVQLISLQKGEDADQLKCLDWQILDWMDMCKDFLDTAALVAELDLIISVDTSVAHLAGALGKPVWLLSRFESEWRWMRDREDSPWYPSMRIFRQKTSGDWGAVVDAVAGALETLVS